MQARQRAQALQMLDRLMRRPVLTKPDRIMGHDMHDLGLFQADGNATQSHGRAAWPRSLLAGKPAVIDVRTEPDVPPLPPHISLEQAKAFASAMFHRDEDTIGMIRASAKQVLDSVLPGRSHEGR